MGLASDEKGAWMDFETFVMFMEEIEHREKEWDEMNNGGHGGRGPRMEIHMEENADGSARMTIIMESAKKLAVSAAAVATAALFSS